MSNPPKAKITFEEVPHPEVANTTDVDAKKKEQPPKARARAVSKRMHSKLYDRGEQMLLDSD